MKDQRQAGFTLLEATFATLLVIAAVGMIATTIDSANKSLHADDVVVRSMEVLQRSALRIVQIMQPCAMNTYRVRATAADVPALAAEAGDWIEPLDGDPRAAIQFCGASGIESMNASMLTSPRTLQLELDSGETQNGIDDDGDGLVDEGDIVLDYDGTTVHLASRVEAVTFTLTGRLVEMRLQAAARRRDGQVQRFTSYETLYLRNN